MDFWITPIGWTLLTLGQILLITLILLLTIAFMIYGHRKIFAGVQMRKGPNVVGPFGLLQSFANLGKFLVKELVVPAGADRLRLHPYLAGDGVQPLLLLLVGAEDRVRPLHERHGPGGRAPATATTS
jgi:NADH:ubiquinone oxidoreductase subunit H